MTMKKAATFGALLTVMVAAAAMISGFYPIQSQFTAKDLKSTLEGMGYELKVLEDEVGKEKWEFTISRHELDIPVGAEISASKNYIWLTVYLGDIKDIGAVKASKLVGLLKGNAKVQPAQFYITDSDGLWCALPMDNRGVTAPIMKRCVDLLVDAVGKNQDLWEGF